MSRIGNKPISIPGGVSVTIRDQEVTIKGPRGQLSCQCPGEIRVAQEEQNIVLRRSDDTKESRAFHGLSRSLVNNMVIGVTEGYRRELQIVGVGYRVEAKGKSLGFSLGFSHPVEFPLPDGITAQVDKKQTNIVLEGIDKQLIGQVAANIRSLRPPDAYKGKGIRYADEQISLKAGKAGKK